MRAAAAVEHQSVDKVVRAAPVCGGSYQLVVAIADCLVAVGRRAVKEALSYHHNTSRRKAN